MKRPIAFALAIVSIVMVVMFLFPELLSYTELETIQKYRDKWHVLYESSPLKIISLFFIFNIFMAMLPVPGISMISFLGGALFGFIPGVLLSSLATAIGNLGGFFLARHFLRNWVIKKYGHRVKIFNQEWEREGAMALFTFRLFPLIPSFVANLIMGVSALKSWTFFWVSWLGRIPMVLVYTKAGEQISKINNIDDILDPKIVASFVMLGLLPWILSYAKKRFFNKPKAL